MNSFEYWNKGKCKIMASNELMALEYSSDKENELDSDADRTVNYKDIQLSYSESAPETAAQKLISNTKDSCVAEIPPPPLGKRGIGSQKQKKYFVGKIQCSFLW